MASIDTKGVLALARVQPICGYGMGEHEIWVKAPEKRSGDKVSVKAKVTQMMVTVIELPAHVVEAHTVDGKLIPAAKLSELLAKERTVLIAMDGKKVDPFYLQLYKEGTIVLVPPASLGQLNRGPYGVIPEPQPIERAPEKRPPFAGEHAVHFSAG